MSVRGSGWILTLAGVAGACTMALELSAVRMLAPWFGTSVGVWTHVIGVVLLALSIGYLAGARLSAGSRPERTLGACLLAASASIAWLPALASPVAGWFLPAGLALDEASDVLGWGSLATALVLFTPSTVLLGCVPPLATEMVQRLDRRPAGSAGGRVLAASTLGSIAGTFGTTYAALPLMGLTRTFVAAGAILLALGVALLLARRLLAAPVLAALVVTGVALGGSRLRPPLPPPGWRLLESAESPYQSVRVVEGGEVGETMRRLQVNEGFDSFQSVWQARAGFLPDGYYYNLFALPPWWSRASGTWRVLVLGLGAGTTWRVLEGTLPPGAALESIGIEIDPRVVELGERWFDLPTRHDARVVLAGWDARAGLAQVDGRFHQVVLDAYANQMEIPAHLCTIEFFEEVRQRLEPAGWLCVNVGGFGLSDPVVEAVGWTVAAGFERRVLAIRVPFSRNCVLFARADADVPLPGSEGWSTGDPAVDRRLAAVAIEGASRWFEPDGGAPLTDDCNSVDLLQRRSIAEGRSRWLEVR